MHARPKLELGVRRWDAALERLCRCEACGQVVTSKKTYFSGCADVHLSCRKMQAWDIVFMLAPAVFTLLIIVIHRREQANGSNKEWQANAWSIEVLRQDFGVR